MCSAGARSRTWRGGVALLVALAGSVAVGAASPLLADGMVAAPSLYRGVAYSGSVEEQAQEAIIIFHGGKRPGSASEDVILRIRVEGEVDNFAWVIPFPSKPDVVRESSELFEELYGYVQARPRHRETPSDGQYDAGTEMPAAEAPGDPVEVISKKTVGEFDVAVVRENEPGALNEWLAVERFQPLARANDLLEFYREKGYVFACVKVSQAGLSREAPAVLHPLRFSFKTDGRDGIYFPMRLSGLQKRPFHVNLYVFYRAWLNDDLSEFGYVHRGFRLNYRDWDTSACEPNAGKTYSAPDRDVFLKDFAEQLPTVTRLFQKLHPGQRYYLTNIQARGLQPKAVRNWSDDLWLFPYYTNAGFVPYDARRGGPASAAWPNVSLIAEGKSFGAGTIAAQLAAHPWLLAAAGTGVGVLLGLAIGIRAARRRNRVSP